MYCDFSIRFSRIIDLNHVLKEKENNKSAEENAPRIKYFTPPSAEQSDVLWKLASTEKGNFRKERFMTNSVLSDAENFCSTATSTKRKSFRSSFSCYYISADQKNSFYRRKDMALQEAALFDLDHESCHTFLRKRWSHRDSGKAQDSPG